MIRTASLLVLVAACSKSEPTPTTPALAKPEVAIELGGVTLGDDCAADQATRPIPPPNVTKPSPRPDTNASQPPAAEATMAAGACADPTNCQGPPPPPCDQTSMQLSLRASHPTTLKIKKIELLDASGKVVDALAARDPSRWVNDKYVTWDEAIGAGTDVAVSYKLSSPNWAKISNGKWNAQNMLFKLRVTAAVGDSDRTIEKQSITVMLEPVVST